ncbi:hypothetical protein GH714_008191 [Hevea brasiliensis]|uniref:Major facilitator superfamily (MFS) profile domain-containing protein n=1 Tax=Hevea brasiliensis TaxID=3981 RepID=A0A6A6LWH2_HEVBR|nr:hypothetical protein GH714_008191 [Hevea brasiliensis]
MADGTKAIFSALDSARTQLYHFKAIVIAGMGFFTDAYDLFCIPAVAKLIGRIYYYKPDSPKPGKLPDNINNAITGVALCGTLFGQLFFGWLGDKLGRKKVYGITLVTMVGCALASGLSFGSTAEVVVTTLCFFRFWLGFGIGGDYPLSAVIMSEYANQKTRGAFIAAVFAMQGMGILFAGAVSTIISKVFLEAFKAPPFSENHFLSTQPEADFAWRIVLMIGAIPAALTFYWRMKMPETARYTALVEGNHKKAAADMARVLEREIYVEETGSKPPANPSSSYGLFSSEFLRRHGIHLLGTTSTWFLLDIAFYSLQLTQKDIYPATGLLDKASTMNALEEMYHLSKATTIIALLATVPGYWFTVFLIDKIGRYIIQLGGFLLVDLHGNSGNSVWESSGEKAKCGPTSKKEFCDGNPILFAVLFGLTLFFANFGPNSTTFIVPAELFPARFRSTCHGLSAAAGKAGAIIGAFVVQSYTLDGKSKDIKKAIIGLAVVNLIGFFLSFLVPETKGRSLEEISGEDKELDGRGNENGRNYNPSTEY